MISSQFTRENIPVLLISICVFLFSALALIAPSGYTYGPVFLFFFSCAYLFIRPFPRLIATDKYLMASLLLYFAVGVFTNIVHHLPTRAYDNFSRFLLAVPVLLLLLRVPVKPIYLWAGIACGALGAGIMALVDFYIYGELRAGGYNNPIQFGDIAILFSCLLMAGFSWAKLHSRFMIGVFVFCALSGILASLLSGARGGWLALPFALGVFYVVNGVHKNTKKTLMFVGVILAIGIWAYYFLSPEVVQMRISYAISDIQAYVQTQNTNTSLGARLMLWQTSLPLIAEQPLIGWGSLANYVNGHNAPDIFQQFNHFHNDFLDALFKRGFLGGFALLLLYVIPALSFYRALKKSSPVQQPFAYAGLLLVMATFVFGLTQSFLSHASGIMMYVFMLVILWAQWRSSE